MKRSHAACLLFGWLVTATALLGASTCFGTTNPFPVSPVIEPAVHFWLDVYTRYPLTSGILHDSRNHTVVYEVLELIHPDLHGARRTNNKRIRKARKAYQNVLRKLARDPRSASPEAQRVAGLFGPKATPLDFQKAAGRIRCQLGQKDRFRDGLVRSGAYIDDIRSIFRSLDLPEDLAYLPHVESSFHNGAYSKYGAAGIWQFTRDTGRRLMIVNDAVDMRLDPLFATRAATELLTENFRKLRSWPLAITAYNHGVAGVRRGKRRHGHYDGIFQNYRTRRFRFASRNFYPEFLAAREAARNVERYFGPIECDAPRPTHVVRMPGYADFWEIADHFDVPPDLLAALNPAFRPPVLKGLKRVPKGLAVRLPANEWQTHLAKNTLFPVSRCAERQRPSNVYRVKRGDTLTGIARKKDVRLADLVAANDLDPRKPLRVRQKLRIPLQLSDRRPLLRKPPKPAPRAAQSPEKKPAVAASPVTTVRLNELTLSPRDIADMTRVKSTGLRKGKPIATVRVEAEETLGHYADWTGIPTGSLRQLNRFTYQRALRLGEHVKVPLHRVTREQFESRRLAYHKDIQDDFFSRHRVAAAHIYQVKPGETIWTLSNRIFDLPAWLIQKYNPEVDFSDLRHSQKLVIPVVEKDA